MATKKPAAKKPTAAKKASVTTDLPTRVVLWLDDDKSDRVWIAQREGSSWKATFGRRSQRNRVDKTHALASPEAAAQAMAKAVASKEAEGYRRAPSGDAAKQLIKQRLGVTLEEKGGKVIITAVEERDDTGWIKVGGELDLVAAGWVTSVDEVAAALVGRRKGTTLSFSVIEGVGVSFGSSVALR